MCEETKAIESNNTWELSPLPVGHRTIGLKQVYKVKRNEGGDVVQHMAHLVVMGYVQRVSVDFDEVFALVALLEFVHLLVALAVHERWTVHHMDVKSSSSMEHLRRKFMYRNPLDSSLPIARGRCFDFTRRCMG
jgi:hypothetical protein